MARSTLLLCSLLSLCGCLSVVDARETAANRTCQYEDRCGNVGSGKTFASFADCLTRRRADWLSTWPTDRCDGRINPETFNICTKAIENTQCNNIIDAFATASKCGSNDVCSAGTPNTTCNCSNGQTCCKNACTNLQSDRNNCGGCGTSCGSGLSCQSGVCR